MMDFTNLIDKVNIPELVKALRYHTNPNVENCDECPYRPFRWSCRECTDRMVADAAAAIEALLKENKELIEDRPEMVETDGHWEWRKPNGEVLMPKRGEWVRVEDGESYHYECSRCGERPLYSRYGDVVLSGVCPMCGAKMTGEEDEVHSGI